MPPINPEDEKLNIILTDAPASEGGEGPRDIEFEHDDFVEPIKERIGDYIGQHSKEGNNRYVIRPGFDEVSTQMPDGKPTPLDGTDASKSAESSFYDAYNSSVDGQKALDAFSSDSDLFDYEIAKGIDTDSSLPTIEEVVQDINTNRGESDFVKEIQRNIDENNVFSSEKVFFDSGKASPMLAGASDVASALEYENSLLNYPIQNKEGKHLPAKWPEVEEEVKNKVTLKDLKNIGIQLMLAGTGEYKIPYGKDIDINLPEVQALITAAPGKARLGLRVPVSTLMPGHAMEQNNPDYKRPEFSPLDNDDRKLSHGSYNNPLVPFDALNTASSRVAAGILILAVSQMLRALGQIINSDKAFSSFNKVRNIRFDDGSSSEGSAPNLYDLAESRMGSAQGESSTVNGVFRFRDPNNILFTRNHAQFSRAVDRGVALFFELGTTGDPLGLLNPLVRSFTADSTNPGYYNVILRMIINDINNVFNNIVPTHLVVKRDETEPTPLSAASLRNSPPALAALDSATNLISVLKESKLLKFMDILAHIGDLSIMSEGDRRFRSIIDATNDVDDNLPLDFANNINLASIVKKNRLSDNVKIGRGNLAWGSNKVPSMYIAPEAILTSEYNFRGERTLHRSLTKDRGFISSPGNRLKMEDIVAYESMLDAYYVPFYFQDLRTNEVIAFQAFIEHISDTFAPEYESTMGIGRVEEVYKYKSTKRNINLEFHVVATNKQDFDEMWFKINKFISMVYPQYTKGREVNSDQNFFTQPFSQLIGSSPMVRMRIGDLIKSNHSDFDVARLHGTSQTRFQLEGQGRAGPLTSQQKNEGELAITLRQNMINGILSVGQHFRLTQPYSSISANDNGIPNIIAVLPGPIAHRLSNGQGDFRPSDVSSKVGTTVNNRTYIEIPTNTPLKVVSAKPVERIYTFVAENPIPGAKVGQLFSVQFLNNVSDISINEADINRNVQLIASEDDFNQMFNEQSQKFFSSAENPVFQSFDTVRGQGLAGFIANISMNHDIANNQTWETEGLNNRAPQSVRITMDFNPVHDISPGLDSDGFMIGAPYNIGEIMKTLKKQRSERARATNPASTNSNSTATVNGTE